MSDCIYDHETKGDVPPYPPSKVTLAFGDDVFPVLVTRLRSEDVEVLIAALKASCRLLPTPLDAVKAVNAGVMPEFVRLAQHANEAVREQATNAILAALGSSQGKEALVGGAVPPPPPPLPPVLLLCT